MAKIRVYELARELNMTNKVLIEQLRENGFEVKSHMSAFDEEEVDSIKTALRGKKTEDVAVEVTRVKPTVIRRRKKQAPEAAPVEETAPETAEEAEEAALEVAAQAQEAPETEAPSAPETEESQEPEKEEAAPEQEASKTEPAAEAEPGPAAEEPPEPSAEAAPEPEPSEAEKEAPAKSAKKKKGKKEAAAKIIKLPVAPPPERAKPSEPKHEPAPEPESTPAAAVESEKPDRRGRKKTEEPSRDKKFFKKKISFRRKEVVEGQDLYDTAKVRGKKGRKAAKAKPAKGQKTQITTPKAIKRRIKIDDAIMLSDLAKRMGIKAGDMIKELMTMGVMATVNQTIDFETASLVAAEFGYEVEKAAFEEEAVLSAVADDETGERVTRYPVVTIMGHVDHGKTSLLDVIRKTHVTETEAGGITQHIGAYSVPTASGLISFLDTPGHEAFTAMRARGAGVTDIVVLVVAADDGVMPQTIEAINHSRAAGVPIIVAINKIDKANADPDKVIRQLAESGLVPEDWGGDTIFVHVSAKQKTGIDELLEMILLQAEVLELKAKPDKLARGHVIEAKLDSGRGPVATVLIQDGTLSTGQSVVCGVHYGKIRAMINDLGQHVDSAGPSIPVEILGLSGVPVAGDEMVALEDEKAAKQVSEYRMGKQRAVELAKSSRVSLESLFDKMKEEDVKELNLIIKADVHGSIEALKDSLTDLSTEEVRINVIHSATGTITESDVSLAAVSDAIILGFNVRPNPKVHELAQEEHVDMRFYDVIYNAIKDIKDAMVGMMESTFEERLLGRAEVRQTFHVPKVGTIAGCYVTDGRIERNQNIRVLREGVIIYDGKIGSLRRYKDDIKEVASGYECGINVEKFNDIKVGDIMECYYLEEIKPELK